MAPRPPGSEKEPPVRLKRPADDLLLAIVLMLCGIGSLFATATSLHSWSLAPLLFLGLCGAGAVYLGRAVGTWQRLRRAEDPQGERLRAQHPSVLVRWLAAAQGWLILLGALAAYVIGFAQLWGPFTIWKASIAIALFVGLGISFDVGNARLPRRRRRKGYVAGRHAARSRRQWPPKRRGFAMASGLLLLLIGNWQWLGYSVDVRFYPLVSHLCWIVSCGFGAGLIGVAYSASGTPVPRRPVHGAGRG